MSSGKKGKKTKGKSLSLGEFLGTGGGNAGNVVAVKKSSWAEESEDYDEDRFAPTEKFALPTAPRAAQGSDVDPERIPTSPPYTAYIANLPFEVDDCEIEKFFFDLKIKSIRLPREGGENGRFKGFGYVEFETRHELVEALGKNDDMMRNRKIRIDVAEGGEGNQRRPFSDRGGGRDEERLDRSEGVSDWRAAPKDPPPSGRDDRSPGRGGFGDRDRRDDRGGFGDRDRGGFGDRDRGGFGDRDRGGGFGDRDRGGGFGDRDRGGGFGDRDRGGGFGDRDRGGGFGDRDRGGGFGDRDRGGGGFGDRDRGGGGFGDRDRDRGGGFGDRDRGGGFSDRDRGGGGYGDRDRGFRDRYGDRGYDRDRGGDRYGGGGGGGRYEGGGRDGGDPWRRGGGDRGGDDGPRGGGTPGDEPRARPKLNLKPRTAPAGDEKAKPAANSSSIFGSAKPVDTATREMEIDSKIHPKDAAPPPKKPQAASGGNIFGSAKPVDTATRERQIEEKLRKLDSRDEPRGGGDNRRDDRRDIRRDDRRDEPRNDRDRRDDRDRDYRNRDDQRNGPEKQDDRNGRRNPPEDRDKRKNEPAGGPKGKRDEEEEVLSVANKFAGLDVELDD